VDYDNDGKPQTVRYPELSAMLLDELQKQDHQLAAQQSEIDAAKQQNDSNTALSERLAALEQKVALQSRGGFLAFARK
jgi:hypothetical protein